ncbi:DUF2185 domain-containing protein [Paenibacillus oleatilyticus]|uniref:DUF2185 domain-containing protein n=1 Tax=Paenibacillus oleatilyticus TaxID=2594886 RepID=UPI001C1FDAF4|nr:DUF2185 domain-containing protein [Paenibacillus oleatilyticus]MBU7317035.1 DUF2185 domain-containing protein [Paenibacillus oleatilyticus]
MAWILDNAVDRHKEAPYTFYIPGEEVLYRLQAGDLVKLIFMAEETLDNGCGAERMWVKIVERNASDFRGELVNHPVYLESPQYGNMICFNSVHICSTQLEDPRAKEMDYYFDYKVIVSNDVLEREQFNFMMKDDPNNEHDTGWVFFSGYEDDDYNADSANFQVVSLGVVLNMDDSIIPYLDAAPPSAYERDLESGKFVFVEDYDWDAYYDE